MNHYSIRYWIIWVIAILSIIRALGLNDTNKYLRDQINVIRNRELDYQEKIFELKKDLEDLQQKLAIEQRDHSRLADACRKRDN